jgi:hypothetical protein
MSDEYDNCGEHGLEYPCGPLCNIKIDCSVEEFRNNLKIDEFFFPPPWDIDEYPEKTDGWLTFQWHMKQNPEYYLSGFKRVES